MVFEAVKLNAVLVQAFPYDSFPDAKFFGDLRHTHSPIEFTQNLCGRIKIPPTTSFAPGNPEFYEPLSDGLGIDSIQSSNSRCGMPLV
jgi:hypothetical protein